MQQVNKTKTTLATARNELVLTAAHFMMRLALLQVLCLVLAGCFGNNVNELGDPWPLAEDGTPLESILSDGETRRAVLTVLNAEKPWKLRGIDPDDGDRLIEGLPNELDKASVIESVIGARPWSTGRDIISKGTEFTMTYQLSDVVPKGYTRVEAFVGGWDEEGYHSTVQFVVIIRDNDHVPVLAAMTSITSNDAPPKKDNG
ncbi:MAG: hypothetical protein IJ092_13890 [Atopobiaceae bacterium]|nr:hypothetical protein [Atopobiaceae bacterium]